MNHWKVLCQILCVVPEFFVKPRGFALFSVVWRLAQTHWNNCDLPKVSKNKQTFPFMTCPNQKNDYQFWTAQIQHNDRFEYQDIFSHDEARNIKFGHQVNLIQRVLWVPRLRRYWRHYLTLTWLCQISLTLVTGATVINL